MKQISAVEWLLENLISEPYSEKDFEHNKNCWDKAELMEKEREINAYANGQADTLLMINQKINKMKDIPKDFQEILNENFWDLT
jgi:hypothetical protein